MELNDVASSSSSSEDESDREVDEALARDVRSALHLHVGKICRQEDASAGDGGDGLGGDMGGPAFATSKEAVAALTDLAYHYSTTLMANDLVAFSKHARRQTVKTEDVLLMARKDPKGMLAELKRAMEEDPDRYCEATKGPKKAGARSRSRSSDGSARKNNSRGAAASKRSGSRGGRKSRRSTSKSKAKSKKGKTGIPPPSSSSSEASDSDDDSDDPLKLRRKALNEERRRAKQKKSFPTSHDSGSDLESFIAKEDTEEGTEDNGGSSSDDVEFDIRAADSKVRASQGGRGSGRGGGDLSDSEESLDGVGGKDKLSKGGVGGQDDDSMAIDLTEDD